MGLSTIKKKVIKKKPCPICGGTICKGEETHKDKSPPIGLMERFKKLEEDK